MNKEKNLQTEMDPCQIEVPPSLTPERNYEIIGTGDSLLWGKNIMRIAITNSAGVLTVCQILWSSSQAVNL